MTGDHATAVHPVRDQDEEGLVVILGAAQVVGEFDMHGA